MCIHVHIQHHPNNLLQRGSIHTILLIILQNFTSFFFFSSDLSIRIYFGLFLFLSYLHDINICFGVRQINAPAEPDSISPARIHLSQHYLNWLTGQSSPEMPVQIETYLCNSALVKEADCCSAGISWGEIMLNFLMTSLMPWPKGTMTFFFFFFFSFCLEEDIFLWQQWWEIGYVLKSESGELMKEKLDLSVLIKHMSKCSNLFPSSCHSHFLCFNHLPFFSVMSLDPLMSFSSLFPL